MLGFAIFIASCGALFFGVTGTLMLIATFGDHMTSRYPVLFLSLGAALTTVVYGCSMLCLWVIFRAAGIA